MPSAMDGEEPAAALKKQTCIFGENCSLSQSAAAIIITPSIPSDRENARLAGE
jgi:hypothetical protein